MKMHLNNFTIASTRRDQYTVRVYYIATREGFSFTGCSEAEANAQFARYAKETNRAVIQVWLGTAKTGKEVRRLVVGTFVEDNDNSPQDPGISEKKRREGRPNKRLSEAQKRQNRMKLCRLFAKATGHQPWEHPRFGNEYLQYSKGE